MLDRLKDLFRDSRDRERITIALSREQFALIESEPLHVV
jgi:hypothetical protein